MNDMLLLRDKSYPINERISVKIYTLNEIMDIGYDKYLSHLSVMLLRNFDIADLLYYEQDIWYEDVTPMQTLLACPQWRESIYFFTGIKGLEIAQKENEIFLTNMQNVSDKDFIILDDKTIDSIREVLRAIHLMNIEKHMLEQASSKFVKKTIIKRQKYDREKDESARFKEKITFSSIVESVAWRSEGSGINILNIWDLTIRQLYSGYQRICKLDKYNQLISGMYSGSLDLKKTNINLEDEFWANLL